MFLLVESPTSVFINSLSFIFVMKYLSNILFNGKICTSTNYLCTVFIAYSFKYTLNRILYHNLRLKPITIINHNIGL